MDCDPSAIHHSWVLHYLIIQNNQQHICKLGLALSRLCFSCHKITAINKCWTPSVCVLAKKNTYFFPFLLEFPAASAVLWQPVGESFGQLVPFWGAQGPLQRDIKLLQLQCVHQILFPAALNSARLL